LAVVGCLIAGAAALLGLVPFPNSTRVEGVVLLPEEAIVRVGEEGFFEQQLAVHGANVKEGDPLFRLSNRELEAETVVLRARMQELAARRDAVGLDDRVAREIHAERLAEARAELAERERRLAGLEVRSPAEGTLRIPPGQGRDLPGRLLRQGELLAYIADQTGARVRVAAPQDDAARIREAVVDVRVRLADSAASVLPGELLGEVPAASEELPSAALGSRGGGAIAVDARDAQGRKALHKVFAFDVEVPHAAATQFVGSRAYVRFEHPALPLLTRWYDAARRLVLKRVGE
jgi:putative peptide zinc metalloprotease protein